MKKVLYKIIVFCSAFALTACDFLGAFLPSTPDNPGGGDTPGGNTPGGGGDTPPDPANVTSISLSDATTYQIGDKFSASAVQVTANYSDGTHEVIASPNIIVSKVTDPLDQNFSKLSKIDRAGEWVVNYKVRVDSKSYFQDVNYTVASGFESTGFTLSSVEYVNGFSFRSGEIVRDKLDEVPLKLHWNKGDEYYTYHSATDTTGIYFSVRKDGDSATEYINSALEEGNSYTLVFHYQSFTYSYPFAISGNYYRLDSNDITNIQTDFDNDISPSKGDVKMLIIPITLSGSYTDTWTNNRLSEIDGYYFGTDTTKMSLKMYYETASFDQMSISGTVTAPYVETNSNLTTDQIQADTSYTKLFTLISNSVDYIRSHNPEIVLDDYDLNDDGAIDNIHLITNFNTDSYRDGTGESPWNTPLWPHKYATGDSGTKTNPVANVYSISAIDHVYDCVTAVHEQGHIFGLDDYYDYGQTDVDYVGYADMQSGNMFDWNSFSKFTVGWVSPYVITGPTEITIGAASLTGDCLVVPANADTFNDSAFDEYFMIELFSPYGNNAVNYPRNGVYQGSVWNYYSNHYNLGDYGVRLYHVNDQAYKYTSGGFVEFNDHYTGSSGYVYRPTDNDIYEYSGRSYYFDDWADYKELAIIQRGGTDTFGSQASGARHYLTSADLFHQGDVFTFDDYKQFLTKTSTVPTTMNNGETFPYKITFTSMSATQVTVKIEYV